MIKRSLLWIVLCTGLIAACQLSPDNSVDFEQERKAILAVREVHRQVHLGKDAKAFVATFAPDFVSVDNGKVYRPSEEESIKRFQAYFDAVEFERWDDISEPEIHLSEDGTMAWVVTRKQVDLTYTSDDGDGLHRSTFAWLAVYEKSDAGWRIKAIASTDAGDEKRETE